MASRTYKKRFLHWIDPWGKGGVDPLQELRGRSSEQFDPVEDREGSFQCKGRSSEWIPCQLPELVKKTLLTK